MKTVLLLLLFTFALPARAGVEQLTEKEFQKLAEDLAPKVNLFRDAWDADPEAQFYGGTTRDFLYWVKGQFREAQTKAAAKKIAAALRARPTIDVREFIIGDSDVDLFSERSVAIRPQDYGVRKIDVQRSEVLDPASELGRNEVNQGFIPAEKIRLSRRGLELNPQLGNGIREIYTGKLTVHFAPDEVFAKSKYAAEGINHPILLAIRYLRLQGINYFQSFGGGPANRDLLFSHLDPASAAAAKSVIERAIEKRELDVPLAKEQFQKWLNAGIQKAFRSYTNPNATKALMEEFHVTKLPEAYPGKVEPVNQYVFARHRDPARVDANLRDYGLAAQELYRPVKEEFPDGFLYHGTRQEEAFRAILLQGVLGSEAGMGGKGLYGVGVQNRDFAEDWGGTKDRLLRFPVKPDATIVDITEGAGERAWQKFVARHGADYEAFAETFGVDVLRYPYETKAYVVKNSSALGRAQGVNREVLPLPDLLRRMRTVRTVDEFASLVSVNSLSRREAALVAEAAPIAPAELAKALKSGPHANIVVRYFLPLEKFAGNEELFRLAADRMQSRFDADELLNIFRSPAWQAREDLLIELVPTKADRAIPELMGDPSFPYQRRLFRALTKELEGQLDVLTPIFRNPAYEREVNTFRDVVWEAESGNAVRMISEVLKEPHWTKYPDLAEKLFELDQKAGRLELEALLKSPAWNQAQPKLLKKFTRSYLKDTSPGPLFALARVLTEAPQNPFDAGMVKALLETGTVLETVVEKASAPWLAPYRKLITTKVLKAEPWDPDLVNSLAVAKLLSPDDLAYARKRLARSLRGKELGWRESIALIYKLRSLTDGDGSTADLLDAQMGRISGTSNFAREHMDLRREAIEGNWAWAYLSDLPSLQERWIREFDQPKTRQLLRSLLQSIPPHDYLPFVKAGLASPHIPPKERAELTGLVRDFVKELGGQSLWGDPWDYLTAYELLRAEPSLAHDPSFVRDVTDLAVWRQRQMDKNGAYLALYLREIGQLPEGLLPYLEESRADLEKHGLHVPPPPEGCPTLFQKVYVDE